VLPAATLVIDAATGAGLIAASIAICGFLGQIKPALAREEDSAVRSSTVLGGIFGLVLAVGTIVVSAA
jgi:uncharacterized membrane protein